MPPRKSPTAQDKPFTFKSKTGNVITIPSKVNFDPDPDLVVAVDEAQASGSELAIAAATWRMVKSGFPDEIAEKLKIKLSEMEKFTTAYFTHTGVSIPK
ncbi:hypothetical protein M3B43_07410 [Nesterenkonia massiliensis]|uniref:Uncharacterized protein n=1 Tax=Nesterenkonia massiliensis TaxID=1232429 RepID=A0ABT2HR35_9MICC|nr:hypothetical protein [Nesterenkonia massiliensis]MCT1607155.1 hypothetical protein [Nesterenkonia massiliensis]